MMMWYESNEISSVWMRWTLVDDMNEMDYGLKEMNEMEYGLKEINIEWDQWSW